MSRIPRVSSSVCSWKCFFFTFLCSPSLTLVWDFLHVLEPLWQTSASRQEPVASSCGCFTQVERTLVILIRERGRLVVVGTGMSQSDLVLPRRSSLLFHTFTGKFISLTACWILILETRPLSHIPEMVSTYMMCWFILSKCKFSGFTLSDVKVCCFYSGLILLENWSMVCDEASVYSV